MRSEQVLWLLKELLGMEVEFGAMNGLLRPIK